MSRVIDRGIYLQLKKAQGETNERLEELVAAQKRTNQLLEWVGGLLAQMPSSRTT